LRKTLLGFTSRGQVSGEGWSIVAGSRWYYTYLSVSNAFHEYLSVPAQLLSELSSLPLSEGLGNSRPTKVIALEVLINKYILLLIDVNVDSEARTVTKLVLELLQEIKDGLGNRL
jgi:hypothetical protein